MDGKQRRGRSMTRQRKKENYWEIRQEHNHEDEKKWKKGRSKTGKGSKRMTKNMSRRIIGTRNRSMTEGAAVAKKVK